MRSWMLITMLMAGLMLDVALALPVNLDDIQETPETDEQLLKLLGGQSMEDTAVSGEQEHLRLRRQPIEDPDHDHTDCHSHSHSHSHAHPDELVHELRKHAARERRAAGSDSSGSSEEKQKGQEQKARVAGDDSSGSSEEKGRVTASPAKRLLRSVGSDSSGSSEETVKDKAKEQKQQDKDDSSSEEKPKRKRREADEDFSKVDDAVPDSEYAQGCGMPSSMLDFNSNELIIRTLS